MNSYSMHYINVTVKMDEGLWWCFTGVYGHPAAVMELQMWELIRRLHSLSLLPWVIVGDFNEILKLNEKLGGLRRNI